MAFINTIPLQQAKGKVRELYQNQQGPYGYVPNYAKVFCYRPQVMTAWASLQKTIRGSIDKQSYELVTLAASRAMGVSYCALAHAGVLSKFFYSEDEIKTIASDDKETVLSEKQLSMMKLAEKVVLESSSINATDIEDLKEKGCSDEQIFDVVACAAARCFFAKLVDSLGALADSPYLELDGELRNLLTVGRAIDSEDVQKI